MSAYEDRPGWAACFPPRNSKAEHPPDFTGVTVIDGKKYWVNVYKRLDRNGNRYVSVNLQPVMPASQPDRHAAPAERRSQR